MKITEILRLKEMSLFTYRDIAQSVGYIVIGVEEKNGILDIARTWE